ncbi:hypothetical protein [Gordonia sp. VNK21]|uniref:hypothetical protein n=1 Tax=Gordonia sp. VNK21 TaxID=3382483 RepID=UPI0038D39589
MPNLSSVRRPATVFLCAVSAAGLLAACSGGDDESELPLTALVLPSDALPAGYTVFPAAVDELVAANRLTLEQAQSVTFEPAACAPTADAQFNPMLTEKNTVLQVAQSDTATLSELVSTVVRNVDADRRATTGRCALVTAVPSKGTLAGARIVTRSTELPSPAAEAVEQALLVRSETITTMPDGGIRTRSSLLSNVLVRRPDGTQITLQLNVGGQDSAVTREVPDQLTAPMSDEDFTALVDRSVERATRR